MENLWVYQEGSPRGDDTKAAVQIDVCDISEFSPPTLLEYNLFKWIKRFRGESFGKIAIVNENNAKLMSN